MATSAERQAAFRKSMLEKGLKPITVWVPTNEAASMQILAQALCDDRDLELIAAPVRNVATGRMVKVL